MSTKASISYSDKHHFYEECFDNSNVYLEVNNPPGVELSHRESCDVTATLIIPIEIWRQVVEDWINSYWAKHPDMDNAEIKLNPNFDTFITATARPDSWRGKRKKETKGTHTDPSEDSLVRDLKKEIIKLKSLCRTAAAEIRDLDDMIIKSIENNKVIEYPEEDEVSFAGFSSINLLNRLDGITNGGYVENYEDLNLEMKALNNKHPSDQKVIQISMEEHRTTERTFDEVVAGNRVEVLDLDGRVMIRAGSRPGTQPVFEDIEEYIPLRSLYEQVISRINKLDDDTREAKGHLNILVLDRFLADITKLVGE